MSTPVFKRRLHAGPRDRTHPLVWLAAIVCTMAAVVVIIGGIAAFVGYLVIHPRVPVISVSSARLDLLRNSLAGLLEAQLTILVRAENGNARAHATFSDIRFKVSYDGRDLAVLMVPSSFEVAKNSSRYLNYVVQSSEVALTPEQMEGVNFGWQRNVIGFGLKGTARTQWRVGRLGSVKFWCHLNCILRFHPLNGSYIPSRCTSLSQTSK